MSQTAISGDSSNIHASFQLGAPCASIEIIARGAISSAGGTIEITSIESDQRRTISGLCVHTRGASTAPSTATLLLAREAIGILVAWTNFLSGEEAISWICCRSACTILFAPNAISSAFEITGSASWISRIAGARNCAWQRGACVNV